jgi:hypothetical protein
MSRPGKHCRRKCPDSAEADSLRFKELEYAGFLSPLDHASMRRPPFKTMPNSPLPLKRRRSGWSGSASQPIAEAIFNRCTDLSLELGIGGRKIDAPEMTRAVALHRFKNEPRSEPAGHTGFDHLSGPQVAGQTPHGTHQPSIAAERRSGTGGSLSTAADGRASSKGERLRMSGDTASASGRGLTSCQTPFQHKRRRHQTAPFED